MSLYAAQERCYNPPKGLLRRACMDRGARETGNIGRPIRVVLADDHSVLRHALATLLDARPDVSVVAQAADGNEAVDLAITHRPDVVLMDVAMPRLNGVEATRQIRLKDRSVRVLMLTALSDARLVAEAIDAGASGFIVKRSDIDELVLALQLVITGNSYFSRELAEQMDIAEVAFGAHRRELNPNHLTDREREVLHLIAQGHTLRSIAELLVISVKTAEGHNSRIMAKLGVKNRAELVRYAVSSGLVHLDEGKIE